MEQSEPEALDNFIQHLHYQAMNTSVVQDYASLATCLDQLSDQYQFETRNTLFYLATPPIVCIVLSLKA